MAAIMVTSNGYESIDVKTTRRVALTKFISNPFLNSPAYGRSLISVIPAACFRVKAAIEPGVGHLKREHRMDLNRLKGAQGDRLNAILSACGMYFQKLLRHAAAFLRRFLLWLLTSQRTMTISVIAI